MKRFKVTVTQSDIDNGNSEYETDAVALALQRRFKDKKASIGFRVARANDRLLYAPIETQEFIQKILRGDKVEPTIFWFTTKLSSHE